MLKLIKQLEIDKLRLIGGGSNTARVINICNFYTLRGDKPHHQGNIYSMQGVCPTICQRDYKDPIKVIL